MSPPLVSVLTTVYNREKFLGAAIESVLAQSFKDFELLVVDDCSKDGSVEIARRYESDPRVKVHVNDRNLGDYPNRNRAAFLARGKYLKYVDADDLIYPHCLEVMAGALESFSDAALALSWNLIDPPKPYPFLSSSHEVYREHYLGRSFLGLGPTAAIIRSDAFTAVGGFSGRQFVGDSELWLKLAHRWPVVSLAPALVWWRRHEGQQMSVEISRTEILDLRFKLELSALENGAPLNCDEKKSAQNRLRQHHARRLLSLAIRRRKLRTAWNLFEQSGLGFRDLLRGLRSYQA